MVVVVEVAAVVDAEAVVDMVVGGTLVVDCSLSNGQPDEVWIYALNDLR